LNQEESLISIIVPVYNAETYIEECLSSIVSQSLHDIDIIIINDGSTDCSKDICEKFSVEDNRITLLNIENGGVANARSIGLNHCKGKYIIHADADDIMLPGALEALYDKIVKEDSDICIGDYVIRYHSHDKEIVLEKVSSEQLLIGILKDNYHSALWNKLIKRELYERLTFERGINVLEDQLIFIRMLLKRPSISFLNQNVYVYRQVEGSYTNSLNLNAIGSIIKATKIIIAETKDKVKDEIIEHVKIKTNYSIIRKTPKVDIELFKLSANTIFLDKNFPFYIKIIVWLHSIKFNNLVRVIKALQAKK
jgi:glycosyltransferase involved in cell wall biosynthesis